MRENRLQSLNGKQHHPEAEARHIKFQDKDSFWDYTKLTKHLFLGQGLIQSIQLDGSGYRVEHQGVKGLRLFACGQDMMLWTTVDDGRSCCMD